jgi:arsenate reductase
MKYRIYHNPRCRKSREGLEYLKSETKDFEIREYIKDGIAADELQEVLDMLSVSPIELCRKQEADFKLDLKGKELSDTDVITVMAANPKLIERPIVVNMETKKAVIGRPSEQISTII